MLNKSDLEALGLNDRHALIRAYLSIVTWGEIVPSLKPEANKVRKTLLQLLNNIPERVVHMRTVQNPVTGFWAEYPVIAKITEDCTYYTTGMLTTHLGPQPFEAFCLSDPWEPQDPKVIAEYNKVLQEQELIYNQKLTGEHEVIRAEEQLKDNLKRYKSTYGRQDHLLVKYQIYNAEGKQLKRIPERFKLKGQLFWQVMEGIEQTILSLNPKKYKSEDQKKAIQERLNIIEEMLNPIFATITRLFGASRYYSSYSEQYNAVDYCTDGAEMTMSIYSLKDAETAQNCVNKQSFMYQDQNNWTTSHVQRQYHTYDSVDLLRFSALDRLIESRYSRQVIGYLLLFYETAKQHFDNTKIYLLRDFCVALGILKPEEEEKTNGET